MTKSFLVLAALLLCSSLSADDKIASPNASTLPSAATDAMPGLKVGEKAVDFALPNTAEQMIKLQDLLEKGKVALVFVRSADWCPFCRRQLQDLQKSLPEIEATGVQLVALSYDSPTTNRAAAAKLGLTFPLLSDVGSKVIDAYGIRNKAASGRGVGIPHPVIFILDQQGVIRVKLMRDGYRDRPEAAEIIAGVKTIK
jgi:peroxiredoxin